jgi:hypothetical protein
MLGLMRILLLVVHLAHVINNIAGMELCYFNMLSFLVDIVFHWFILSSSPIKPWSRRRKCIYLVSLIGICLITIAFILIGLSLFPIDNKMCQSLFWVDFGFMVLLALVFGIFGIPYMQREKLNTYGQLE